MSSRVKIGGVILIALLLVGAGYGIATWRHQAWIAGYSEREQKRMDEIKVNNAQQDQLRGESNVLREENAKYREHVAKLSAEDEGLKAIIDSRGGQIAAEAKNLENISEGLKTNLAVVSAPGDKCVRCRAYSDELLRARQIGIALTCKDECAGVAR